MSQASNASTTREANSSLDATDSKDDRLDKDASINTNSKKEDNPGCGNDENVTVDQEASQNPDGNQGSVLRLRIESVFDLIFPLNSDGTCYRLDYYRTPWGYKEHLIDELRAINLQVCEDEADDQSWHVKYHTEENPPGIQFLMHNLGRSSNNPKFRVSIASRGFDISSAEDHTNAMLEVEKACLAKRKAARDMLFYIDPVPENEDGTIVYISPSSAFSQDSFRDFLMLLLSYSAPIDSLSRLKPAAGFDATVEWQDIMEFMFSDDHVEVTMEHFPKAIKHSSCRGDLSKAQELVFCNTNCGLDMNLIHLWTLLLLSLVRLSLEGNRAVFRPHCDTIHSIGSLDWSAHELFEVVFNSYPYTMDNVAKASQFVRLFKRVGAMTVREAPTEFSGKYFSDDVEDEKPFPSNADLYSARLSPEFNNPETQGFSLEEFDSMYTMLSGIDQMNLGPR